MGIFIPGSVSTELRDLEYRRQKLQAEILTCIHKIDQYKNEIGRQQTELDKLKMSVQQVCRFYLILLEIQSVYYIRFNPLSY